MRGKIVWSGSKRGGVHTYEVFMPRWMRVLRPFWSRNVHEGSFHCKITKGSTKKSLGHEHLMRKSCH